MRLMIFILYIEYVPIHHIYTDTVLKIRTKFKDHLASLVKLKMTACGF